MVVEYRNGGDVSFSVDVLSVWQFTGGGTGGETVYVRRPGEGLQGRLRCEEEVEWGGVVESSIGGGVSTERDKGEG